MWYNPTTKYIYVRHDDATKIGINKYFRKKGFELWLDYLYQRTNIRLYKKKSKNGYQEMLMSCRGHSAQQMTEQFPWIRKGKHFYLYLFIYFYYIFLKQKQEKGTILHSTNTVSGNSFIQLIKTKVSQKSNLIYCFKKWKHVTRSN